MGLMRGANHFSSGFCITFMGLKLILQVHTFDFSINGSEYIMVFSEVSTMHQKPHSSKPLKSISFSNRFHSSWQYVELIKELRLYKECYFWETLFVALNIVIHKIIIHLIGILITRHLLFTGLEVVYRLLYFDLNNHPLSGEYETRLMLFS